MRLDDVPGAMHLCEAAGWNQTPEDWLRVLELEPEGCLALECDGKVVATTTAVCFERELAWIGMVLTHPDYRRRGYAKLLMERILEYLDERRVRWLKLDATDMGAPLYRNLGFVDECRIERWTAVAAPRQPAGGLTSFALDAELDRAAFGADRTELLWNLARVKAVSIDGEGFAMARPGANAAAFGPCVAKSSEAARTFLHWFLAEYEGEKVFWDILPDNRDAVRLATEYGFERARELVRMAKPGVEAGEPLTPDNTRVYAAAGFEYG